jgi:hypothetical protein
MGAKKENKSALIISVYPGMLHEALVSINTGYIYISSYTYQKDNPEWYIAYVNDVLKSIKKSKVEVCFIDTETDVLDYLLSINETFFILYPMTTVESIMKHISTVYAISGDPATTEALADVVKNHDTKIEALKKYPNSLASQSGIVNVEILNELKKMTNQERRRVIGIIKEMKQTKK